MQKEGSDNDSQTGDDIKENEHPAKRMRHEESHVWDSSDMFMVETPVSCPKKFGDCAEKFWDCAVDLVYDLLELFYDSQSKTLASDSGVIFSPPSKMREALDDSELYLNDDEDTVYIKRRNREPAPKVRLKREITLITIYSLQLW